MKFRGNISRSHIKHDSRRIPIYGNPIRGDGLDANRYFRCWHCGFICDSEVNALGDSQSRDGIITQDYPHMSPEGTTVSILVRGGHITSESDSEGNPKTSINSLMISKSSFGCPLCGTLNWRGDY